MSPSKVSVERWDEAARGPVDEAVLRERIERLGYAVSRYTYPPGTVFPPHVHDVDKIDAVVSGRFEIEMLGTRVVLGPGDFVRVPKGVRHAARVVGDEPVVSLDAIRAG